MVSMRKVLLGLLALSPFAQANKDVYAHFIVGIVGNYGINDWKMDMIQAQAIGIDGFALNCAPPRVDSFTPTQLANAYAAAQQLGFTVFVSFDFSYWNNGDTATITSILQQYAGHPAQARYNGGALVSTFIGDDYNWTPIKNALGSQKLTVVPNLQNPSAIASATTGIDGVFSWYAWPEDTGNTPIAPPMTTKWDLQFMAAAGNKIYMAPVSAWFFTHFSSKNFIFACEDEATRRWDEILQLQPDIVEIVTWNDFGESHYISGPQPNHSDDGSSQWAKGFNHAPWQTLMAPYIAAYKTGASAPKVTSDRLVYWYRPTPKGVTCTNDPLPRPNGYNFFSDVIFASVMLTAPATLTVTSGNQAPATVNAPAGIHTFNFTMGVGQQKFSVSRGGKAIISGTGGLAITNSCATYNYNVYVGSVP